MEVKTTEDILVELEKYLIHIVLMIIIIIIIMMCNYVMKYVM